MSIQTKSLGAKASRPVWGSPDHIGVKQRRRIRFELSMQQATGEWKPRVASYLSIFLTKQLT